ncbi:DUF3667 domain-containing protein [Phenylobacterium sp. LH3H17]|uniref:DUF3667 domain-containing protein n=1 Tax=Phenylobacterium sp. LH3H17 TaxID=2903901 RepID=UPI0020CA08D5|nr:DUF3667 domain-containing protein [Phenylobacterium sp. LH3H17]UTP37904.1 DUF3667 domain-containing protein [Phenylobacterium sp. LH3H17]
MELDAVGGAATGGLIGAAIEKPTGQAGEHSRTCTDCGAEVSGRFCQNCGQPTHVHRTLLHLGEELLHGVMHFDSHIWRTLPLLVLNPGKLTREWVHGKRTRYVSPLAMFLFTVFVMFMLLSFMPTPGQEPDKTTGAAASSGTRLFNAANAVNQAETALNDAPKGTDAASVARRAALQERVDGARAALEEANKAMEDNPTPPDVAALSADWAKEVRAKAESGEWKANTGNKALDDKLNKKLKNPELALYKIQQTFYKFSFLLVPISLPFVAALFLWKRGFTFYDHGVFVLYSLTFMAMLIMVAAAIVRWGGSVGGTAAAVGLWFIIPAHMFAQLKGAYSLGVFSTVWRTFVLLNFCLMTLLLFLFTVIMLGLTG